MPVYEYVCTTCRNRFEKLRPMEKMDEEAPCPGCGGDSSRALSVFAAFMTDSYGNTRASFNLGAGGELDSMAGMLGGGCACGSGGSCSCSAG